MNRRICFTAMEVLFQFVCAMTALPCPCHHLYCRLFIQLLLMSSKAFFVNESVLLECLLCIFMTILFYFCIFLQPLDLLHLVHCSTNDQHNFKLFSFSLSSGLHTRVVQQSASCLPGNTTRPCRQVSAGELLSMNSQISNSQLFHTVVMINTHLSKKQQRCLKTVLSSSTFSQLYSHSGKPEIPFAEHS